MGNKWCASCKSQSQLTQKPPSRGNLSEDQAERTATRDETRDGEAQPVSIATTLTISANERKLVAESEIQLDSCDERGHLAKIDSPSEAGSVPAPSVSAPKKIAFKEDANTERKVKREVSFGRTRSPPPPHTDQIDAERRERDRWQDINEDIDKTARYIVDINIFIASKVLYPALEHIRQETMQTRNSGEGREQLMR